MKRIATTTFVTGLLLVSGSVASAQTSVSVGIQIGPPPPPQVVYVVPSPPPAPEYVWIEGYWYPVKHHYKWHDGYWTRPPYPGARWIAASYDGRLFFDGYWEGGRGRYAHDHRWDRDRDRDYRDSKREHARRGEVQKEQWLPRTDDLRSPSIRRLTLEHEPHRHFTLLPRQRSQNAAERIRAHVGNVLAAQSSEVVPAQHVEHLSDQFDLRAPAR